MSVLIIRGKLCRQHNIFPRNLTSYAACEYSEDHPVLKYSRMSCYRLGKRGRGDGGGRGYGVPSLKTLKRFVPFLAINLFFYDRRGRRGGGGGGGGEGIFYVWTNFTTINFMKFNFWFGGILVCRIHTWSNPLFKVSSWSFIHLTENLIQFSRRSYCRYCKLTAMLISALAEWVPFTAFFKLLITINFVLFWYKLCLFTKCFILPKNTPLPLGIIV